MQQLSPSSIAQESSGNIEPQNYKTHQLFQQTYNRQNPNTWQVLAQEQAIPLDAIAKAYMLKDLQSWTRRYLLIPIKIIANLALAVIMTLKRLLPFQFNLYGLMHRAAAFFLQYFVSPEACYLIVRHICLGSNIINFLIDNGPDINIEKSKLYPRTIANLAHNAFLDHDLILYNFVWDYSQAQAANPNWLEQVRGYDLNYESIHPVEVEIDFENWRWLRILDLESAIELFKVFYSFCLTSDEFERAVLSLQLDENFGVYISQITGDYDWNHVITNRHPLIPNSPFNAARDLFLHGLVTEYLHRYLELKKYCSKSC